MLDFLDFSFLDILDIVLVAVLLYYVYKLLKGTVAINIFIGIALVILIWKITQALQMEMLSGLLGTLISLGAIAILIVFQPEVRKFLLMIGSTNFTNKRNFLKQLTFLKTEIHTSTDVESVVLACENMATTKTGVLIVLERTHNLDFLKSTGDKMNAEINQPILKSIFYKYLLLDHNIKLFNGRVDRYSCHKVYLQIKNGIVAHNPRSTLFFAQAYNIKCQSLTPLPNQILSQ